jgi:hypothetical protein
MGTSLKHSIFTRLFVFALFCSYASHWIAYEHEFSCSAKASSPLPCYANHLWIWVQGFLLTLPGFAIGYLLANSKPVICVKVGRSLMLVALAIQTLDLLAFTYYRDRLFSGTSAKIFFELSPTLALNLNFDIIFSTIIQSAAVIVLCIVAWKLSDFIASQCLRFRYCPSPRQTTAMALAVVSVGVFHPFSNWTETVAWMKRSSDRQPLVSLGLFGETEIRPDRPRGREVLTSSLPLMSLEPELREHEQRYSTSSVVSIPEERPDILLVIIESLRHKAISAKTSPNIHALTERGIWAKKHFTTANSTNVAMFSILFGLESIWSERRRDDEPALIRTARQCGYETGFFGGADDWGMFNMDGFICPKNFDVFETSAVDWTTSDARMCQLAQDFLDSKEPTAVETDDSGLKTSKRKPKLAVLYLYCTHFDYQCDEIDKIHEPALEGRLTVGYSLSERDQVWNRYLNSVHCVDRLIGPLLDPKRLVCVVGDHGESFLEDNYRVHGGNISRYQNMTPCIVAGPGIEKSTLNCLTSHTDIVPTLFDACGVQMKSDPSWEGDSMRQMPLKHHRTIVTRDYLQPEIAIINEKHLNDADNFGHRCLFSLADWTCFPGGTINECGVLVNTSQQSQQPASDPLNQWLSQRFESYGANSTMSEVAQIKLQMESSNPGVVDQATKIAAYLSPSELAELQNLLSPKDSTNWRADVVASGDSQSKRR